MADFKNYVEDLINKDKAELKLIQEKIDAKAGPLLAQKAVVEAALQTKAKLLRDFEKVNKPGK